MMSFCKKSVHSFLGLTISMNHLDISNNNNNNNLDNPNSSSSKCVSCLGNSGLGLITAPNINRYKSPPNVVESTNFKSFSPPTQLVFKKDPGGIGFIDDVGGGVNGLMSCTESLGFESCDERRVDDGDIDELCSRNPSSSSASSSSSIRLNNLRKVSEKREVKKFPPPLSSLNHNGQPNFILRPSRKDGRLELTEVRIDRPEILRASREDGRLRLHLIRDDEDDDEDEEQDQEEENMKEDQEVEEEEEMVAGEWRFPVNAEGLTRCHEEVSHRHHHSHSHNLHIWRQHCVTTR